MPCTGATGSSLLTPYPVLTVRRAEPADAAAVSNVAVQAYQGYVPRIGRRPAPMTADYAEAIRGSDVWVAAEDGEIIGLLVLSAQSGHLLIENVAVLPSAQRRGVGATLLALAEDEARRLGLSELRLYTNEAMIENQAYYRSHGYAETHRAEHEGFRRVFFRKR